MIEYLVMAFFAGQPVQPAAATPRPGTTSKAEAPQLGEPVRISSDLVTGSRNQAVFKGNVVVKHRTMDMRCDKMITSYNAAHEVTRAECVGSVRATDGERTVKGERADFNVPTGVLVMTGNPEARDRTTHLRGTRVRMTLGNENFEVENAVITVEPAPLMEQRRDQSGGKGR